MLKSLYAGVSGLQSHQIAMDVESNNIANVNTTGFKYSRANFSDLLAQTKSIATAPQGELGGKNAVQVGLGSTVSSMTTIHSQGSIQNSDKNTDVAIQGDGFFIVSPDNGKSYKYTRAGDFKFDASGNFVDNNGFIVQGWVRDSVTGKVDATAPIESIRIPPGLTTPASPTTEVSLKANLNAGIFVESYSPAYEVKSGIPPAAPTPPALDADGRAIESGDLGVMFNDTGEGFALQPNQGIWASFEAATLTAPTVVLGSSLVSTFSRAIAIGDTISATVNGTLYSNTTYAAFAADVLAGEGDISVGIAGDTLTFDSATDVSFTVVGLANDNGSATGAVTVSSNNSASEMDVTFTLDNGVDTVNVTTSGSTGTESAAQNGSRFVTAINSKTALTGISATYDSVNNKINLVNTNDNAAASHNIKISAVGTANSGFVATAQDTANHTAYRYQYNPTGANGGAGGNGFDKTFKTIADLRNQLEIQGQDNNGDTALSALTVKVNSQGKLEIENPAGGADPYDVALAITGITTANTSSAPSENTRFTRNLEALNSSLSSGSTGKAFSQSFNAATHSSSIDIFDSLGSKHTIRMEFRKTDVDLATGSTWNMRISVPAPATIDNTVPYDQKDGSIRFNSDGSLATYNPPNVSFTGNNGSAADQQVSFSFGTSNLFDGMTSFDSRSSTSGISQDGFTGGDLVGIRIDQSGTMVGSFSNGRSFGLAQVGMAKFTNNEGLATEGGSVYVQTANSGDPIIGSAATSGRGFIQSSALEASNVDLSRSLTQLIIIQRGYQANGKTITTSDQLLETLIGLKR
ncbi:flagellar hook protein FlgE [Candidatus Sulfurimonas baltica]|uniref:Flagellar hook protein FlgE n=1 Tax=Candidatus Sulfurimonas baltica TaxID=2740404 RepID=A0A7S7RMF5_9BACT|nr:flagellar hook protein FlgE [Candidatus Sulfurimonas baltica]QOY52152.1 flagellar hook protein FlgE [Candidatus Sulfurimonas baltica]